MFAITKHISKRSRNYMNNAYFLNQKAEPQSLSGIVSSYSVTPRRQNAPFCNFAAMFALLDFLLSFIGS